MALPGKNALFHVHTFRCKHAGDYPDREYVEKVLELGADQIWFTDHAPFPGNPFGNRMDIEELPEYVSSLKELREEFAGKIEVKIGLEIEYLPYADYTPEYYQGLRDSEEFDILMLGQHFYQEMDGTMSFDTAAGKGNNEMCGMSDNIVKGIMSSFFDAVAHPDRIFRRRKVWDDRMAHISEEMIRFAVMEKIPLEKNLNSMRHKHHYWKEFWEMVPKEHPVIYGIDAHAPEDLERWKAFMESEK